MSTFSYAEIDESIQYAARKLGIENIRELQLSTLRNFIKGFDVFCSLPTGYGKSFNFQAFHLCCNKLLGRDDTLSLVVFPIRSLIEDQIAKLKDKGIQSLYIDGSTSADEIRKGNFSLLFATPENLVGEKCAGRGIFSEDDIRKRIRAIFIDECHVVTQWGFADKDRMAFRHHYSQLADLRAMLSPNVPLMALTATATLETRNKIINNLAMRHVHLVTVSPNRDNIKLVNMSFPKKDYDCMFSWLVKDLHSNPKNASRIIVYCRTLQQCRELYGIFYYELKCKKGDENIPFASYHSESPSDTQETVLQSFSQEDGHVRVLFSSVAFGMGVDVKDVHTIIHLGVPSDPASLLQESGRAGRDGKPSISIIIKYPGTYQDCKVDSFMKEYVDNNTVCRRHMILQQFGYASPSQTPHHSCCDVCTLKCKCGGNECAVDLFPVEVHLHEHLSLNTQVDWSTLPRRTLNMDKICELNENLMILRMSQLSSKGAEATNFLAGEDIVSGIPTETIDKIVAEAHIVLTFEQFKERYAVYSDYRAVWEILSNTVGNCPIKHVVHTTDDNTKNSGSEQSKEAVVDEFAIICDEEDYGNESLYHEGEFANACSTLSSDDDYFE